MVKLFFRTRIVYAGGPLDMLNGRAREKAPPLDVPFTDAQGPPHQGKFKQLHYKHFIKFLLIFSQHKTRADILGDKQIYDTFKMCTSHQ